MENNPTNEESKEMNRCFDFDLLHISFFKGSHLLFCVAGRGLYGKDRAVLELEIGLKRKKQITAKWKYTRTTSLRIFGWTVFKQVTLI